MSDRDRPLDFPGDSPGPEGRSGGLRPLLALASLVPLMVAAGALAMTAPAGPVTVERALTSAEAGGARLWCPGPLDPPQEVLGTGSDADLAVVPPSPSVGVRTIALEPTSSLLFGRVSGSETQLEEDGSVRAPSVTASGEDEQPLPVPAVSRDLGASVHTVPEVEDTLQVQATGSEGGRPVADSVQTTITTQGDYRSLSMSRCLPVTTSASFLGVSTQRGSSSQLVLSNPGDRPATAAVQVWTSEGPAAMAGRSQVVVAPRTEQRILLESIVPGHDQVGVGVEVIGAPLAMHVQATEREGLTPGGAEILDPLDAASPEIVIPGVRNEQTAPTLVLANSQGEDTTATVTVLGTGGALADAGLEDIEVPAGAVVAIPLEGLAQGDHAVRVDAADPLHAVVRSEVTAPDLPGDTIGAPVDFALAAPAPAVRSHAVTALPATGPAGHLALVATEDTQVTLVPIGADGSAAEPLTLELAEDAVRLVPVADLNVGTAAAAGVVLVPEAPGVVHASWVQQQSDGAEGQLLSVLPVPLVPDTAEAVRVRLAE